MSRSFIPKRILSGLMATYILMSPFGPFAGEKETGEKKVMSVNVGENGYETVEEARDYVRTLDKSEYSGIEIVIDPGNYELCDTFRLTSDDSGTEACPITYKSEGRAYLIGGFRLSGGDFSKAEGDFMKYFPEEVKDELVMADLKEHGITPEMIAGMMDTTHYHETICFLSRNGVRETIAQFPNDWMHIDGADTYDSDGNIVDVESSEADWQRVSYEAQYADTVHSWSEVLPIYIRGRFFKLWCPDDSRVIDMDDDDPLIDIRFNGGHLPTKGGIMYFFNVPEALDMPGEYIIDSDAVLYYYPTDDFESAQFTVPKIYGIMESEGADWLRFENITFEASLGDGITVTGNNIVFDNCTVSGIQDVGARFTGNEIEYKNGSVHDIGADAVFVRSGDIKTLTGGHCSVFNNDIYNYSMTNAYGYAVDVRGFDVNVSHNDVHDAGFKAIHFSGAADCTAEYNDVYRVLLLCDDVGAMSIDSKDNANIVFRYNYVHDIGPVGEAAKMKEYNPGYEYYGADAFYHDGGASYVEMYGNIINDCDDGYRSNGGRCNSFHNNLVINCHMWYCIFVEVAQIDQLLDEGIHSSYGLPDHVYSDVWKEKNPDLYGLITNTEDAEDLNDPAIWCAPAHLEAYDNYFVYNKAEREFTNWGIRPYNKERYIDTFSPGTIEEAEEHLITYSSARYPLDLEDTIEKTSPVTGITLDIFNRIGRIE